MIAIPTVEQEAFQGSLPKDLILNFPIGRTLTNENIYMESMSLEQSVCEESNLTFGAVYSSCFSVRILDDGLSYSGLIVFPNISVTVGDTTYSRNLGEFVVKSDKLTSDKTYRDLKCYDALANVLPFDYSQWHNQRSNTFTVKQYRDAFFSYIGITQETVALPNDNVTLTKFAVDKISGSQILSAILQLNGAFGYIGYDGKFKYVFPKTTPDYTIEDYSFVQGSFNYEDEPIKKISGVTIKGYSDDYGEEATLTVADVSAGNSTFSMLTISDNYLVHACSASVRQTLCTNLYNALVNFTYYPSSVQFPAYVGLELGDVFQIITERKTVTFPVLKRTLSGITALKDAIEAKGETEITSNSNSVSSSTDSAQMAINQIRLSVSELLAGKATVNQLYAVTGRIENLETNYLTVNSTLTAHTADIQTLNTGKANVTDLNAATARITTLEGGYANIGVLEAGLANVKSLLAGNAGVGDLQTIHLTASNAVVDQQVIKNLVSQYITVNDLLAGTINTNKFIIQSNDGAIKIDGSTQTFKDASGNTRIQMGQDAQGNFTFVLYDASGQGVLIDATGIKESAISDGLIKDAKVAADAGIKGSKLDIDSVVTELNKDGTPVLKSSKIWFDSENQSLNQMYSQISSRITLVGNDASDALDEASAARSVANEANSNAQIAIRALEGITSLDNLMAVLSNDAHTIHTYYDGTGGSYYGAETTVAVYKGDTDVTEHAQIDVVTESNVVGAWNPSNRTYTVTELTADDGYVDFSMSYGTVTGHFYMPDEKRLVMPDGKILKMNSDAATVHKRFSLSKSPDGRAGQSWNLMVSSSVVNKKENSTFNPPSVVFSANYNDGMTVNPFSGRFLIEESTDGTVYTETYSSTRLESSHTYIPSNTAKFIKCSLYDGNNLLLDTQSVIVIADTDEISGGLSEVRQGFIEEHDRVGNVITSVERLSADFSEMDSKIYGISNGTMLFQTPYNINGDIATFDAILYRPDPESDSNSPRMLECHADYRPEFYRWYRKTEDGIDFLGYGYRMQVDRTTVGYGGSIVGVFEYWNEGLLVMPDGNYIKFPDEKRLLVYAE